MSQKDKNASASAPSASTKAATKVQVPSIQNKSIESSKIIESINDIYDKYNIMPNLRMHMVRVASVANLICDYWHGTSHQLNSTDIIATALLHDLGNIVKFKFTPQAAHFYGPEASRTDYWQTVQEATISRYGTKKAHEVTDRMMEEIGASPRLRFFAINTTPQTIAFVANTDDYDLKVFVHSDQRVAPSGVVSVEKRIKETRERFKRTEGESPFTLPAAPKEPSFRLQNQVFRNTTIRPEQVNDASIRPYFEKFMRK